MESTDQWHAKRFIMLGIVGVVIVFIVSKFMTHKGVRAAFIARGKAIQTQAPLTLSHATCPHVDENPAASAPIVITFPMQWNNDTGEFRVTLSMGGYAFMAVVDTGSEYLIVGSNICDGCDTAQGFYNTSSATGVNSGQGSTVAYGSQTDTIQWYIDEFSAGDSDKTCIEFGVVTKVVSTQGSNMNILGLATSHSFAERTPFLDQLICTQQVTLPYMYFDFKSISMVFALGQPHAGADTGARIDYVGSDALSSIGLDFDDLNYYFLQPKKWTINGQPMVPFPKFCMFDTGTTLLQVSSNIAKEFDDNEGKTLLMDFGEYTLPYEIYQGTFQIMDDFGDDICILGNQNMLGRVWSFDLDDHTITVIE